MTPPSGIDVTRPSIARVYDYLLGGENNYPADRAHAAEVLKRLPRARDMAIANRQFLIRAVRFLAGAAGIRQFIDLGSGLPTQHNVHEVARELNPAARVVYVDHDPAVLVHARVLLADDSYTTVIKADMRALESQVLQNSDTQRLIRMDEPVGVLLLSVLHWIGDEDDPYSIVEYLRYALTPGSYLALTHALSRPETRAAAELYQQATGQGTARTRYEVERFFDGWELVEPGLVQLPDWRPDSQEVPGHLQNLPFVGGVACKPS